MSGFIESLNSARIYAPLALVISRMYINNTRAQKLLMTRTGFVAQNALDR